MGNKWKKHRANKQLKPQSGTVSLSLGKRIWEVVVAVSVILGLFVAIYALLPKIIVSPGERTVKTNPFSTMFHVMNDGLFDIYSASFRCIVHEVTGVPNGLVFKNNEFSHQKHSREKLQPGESATVSCFEFDLGPKMSGAEVSLIVSFRRSYWFLQTTKQFSYRGEIANEQVYWIPTDTKKNTEVKDAKS